MRMTISNLRYLALLIAAAPFTKAFDDIQARDLGLSVVLRRDESVNGANDETRFYFDDRCYVEFPPDGSLRSGIFGTVGLWDTPFSPNTPNSLCAPPVRYKLQGDGNFVTRCTSDNTVTYTTHSHQSSSDDFFMAIDKDCELHIFKGTFGCDEVDVLDEVWSSARRGSWQVHDRLFKGQIYYGLHFYDVVMNPYNGNLEVRNPGSRGTYDIVWSSMDEWAAPPGDHLHDYYAKLTERGDLILVGINYEAGIEEEYFSKNLENWDENGCNRLGFEVVGSDPFGVSDPIDLIAVPCDS